MGIFIKLQEYGIWGTELGFSIQNLRSFQLIVFILRELNFSMAKNNDIRWLQRFANYNKALLQLRRFILKNELNEFEEQGLIKSFEYTYELAWNTIKDFYEDQGEVGIQGSKDAVRLAFKRGLIVNGEAWLEMIENRKLTVHTYNEAPALEISNLIKKRYFDLFLHLQENLETIRSGNQSSLFKTK
jgi:nucleotidyltransferase substrate binding protein (TIGR01987 family)